MFQRCFFQGLSHIRLSRFPSSIKNFSTWKDSCFKRSWRKDTVGCQNINKQTFSNTCLFLRNMSTNPLNINTKVINNVMLYRFEKPWMYKIAAGFAIFALVGCLAMADNVYLILCKDLFNSNIDWGVRLRDHFLPVAAIGIGLVAGPAITVAVWYITVRTMKYIILRKGGNLITFVTYHPLKGEVRITVPVEDVSCKSARDVRKGYVSIKIKNHKSHYIIDKSGHFVNPELFDSTVGVKRF